MIRVRGEQKPLRFWPGQPNTWGRNPYKKPLYRVVWSESRLYLLGGEWPDGRIEYRWAPYYAGRKEWVLEKWLSPEEFAGSKETWESDSRDPSTGLYRMGPYPSMGWYDHCYSFPEGQDPNMSAIVPLLEYGRNHHSFQQIRTAIHLWHEKQRKDWDQRVMDGMAETLPAFGFNPTNLSSTKPTGDTAGLAKPEELSAEIAKHRGKKREDAPEFTQLPRRGMSMGRQKGN